MSVTDFVGPVAVRVRYPDPESEVPTIFNVRRNNYGTPVIEELNDDWEVVRRWELSKGEAREFGLALMLAAGAD